MGMEMACPPEKIEWGCYVKLKANPAKEGLVVEIITDDQVIVAFPPKGVEKPFHIDDLIRRGSK